MFWVFFGVVCFIGMIMLMVMRNNHDKTFNKQFNKAVKNGTYDESEREDVYERNKFPIPAFVNKILATVGITFIIIGSWNGLFFMAEERYSYFVRDIAGKTHVYTTTGWHWKGFGNVVPIKNEMSIQFSEQFNNEVNSGSDVSNGVSVMMAPRNVTFLDQVTANVSTTVRFRMPTDKDTILKIIDSFGDPNNLMRSLLIPSTERTVDATSALMTADKYFSGGKTEFMNEFDRQMRQGLYVVEVKEVLENPAKHRKGSANASKKNKQDNYGDDRKVVYRVVKVKGKDGTYLRTPQEFQKYGISVTAALVTKMDPNPEFKNRMKQKQQASADLAIARENRKKEEEKELLAVAKGKREVAEAQAEELKKQIVETTRAETGKQLAITKANKELESARIQEQTAKVQYKRDQIKAKSVKVLADADAYAKRVVIEANGALEQKIEAYKYAIDRMATAVEKRKVPQSLIMMGGAKGNDLAGSSSSINQLMEIIAADSAKNLSLDLTTKAGNISGK